MTDREKIIKGLNYCLRGSRQEHENCPYIEECDKAIALNAEKCPLLDDLLAILREQETRVMTADEVQEDELVWIEEPQSNEIWPALLRKTDWFGHPTWAMRGYVIAGSFLHDGYGRDWRCWTARPTDEQRKAVKW